MARSRYILLSIALLAFLPGISLAQRTVVRDKLDIRTATTRSRAPRFSHKAKQDNPLKRIQLDDETSILFDTEGTFLYMGGIGQLKNGNCFPSGEGICRVDGEYCLCPWKRGSRHGKGIIKTEDGAYRNAVWRWDHLKSVSEEEPSSEDINRLENTISRMEQLLRLL